MTPSTGGVRDVPLNGRKVGLGRVTGRRIREVTGPPFDAARIASWRGCRCFRERREGLGPTGSAV